MKRSSFISFLFYLILTLAFAYLDILTQQGPDEPIQFNKDAPDWVGIIQAIGYAGQQTAVELGIFLRFVTWCVFFNILFFVTLKFARGFKTGETIILMVVTLTVSVISYSLLHPVLNWAFGEYQAVTFTLLVWTFIICRWHDIATLG
jgi:hypothetical protein